MTNILFGIALFILGLVTILSKRLNDKLVIQTHKPVLDKSLQEAVNYSTQLLGLEIKNLQQLKVKEQDKFVGHALGYLRMNYVQTLKELNIDGDNNDLMCSLIIGSIGLKN